MLIKSYLKSRKSHYGKIHLIYLSKPDTMKTSSKLLEEAMAWLAVGLVLFVAVKFILSLL